MRICLLYRLRGARTSRSERCGQMQVAISKRSIGGWPMTFQRANSRPNEPPMPEPLSLFLTWTTYGTWLPGDKRGWVLRGRGFQPPNPQLERRCRNRMKHPPCFLDYRQRELVEAVVRQHCMIRGWHLHAVRCRSNHVHVVVTAPGCSKKIRDELKA